jgi:hypothetical protein
MMRDIPNDQRGRKTMVRVLTADFFLLCSELFFRFIDLSADEPEEQGEVPEP